MTTLYGIKNCDTVKKARNWLEKNNVDYQFHDFRGDGITTQQIDTWIAALGVETLINKRSTTWKELTPSQQADFSPAAVQQLILTYPTLIKRPLLEHEGAFYVGFKEPEYTAIF